MGNNPSTAQHQVNGVKAPVYPNLEDAHWHCLPMSVYLQGGDSNYDIAIGVSDSNICAKAWLDDGKVQAQAGFFASQIDGYLFKKNGVTMNPKQITEKLDEDGVYVLDSKFAQQSQLPVAAVANPGEGYYDGISMLYADQVLFFFEEEDMLYEVGVHILGEVGNLEYPFTNILPFAPEGSCAVCLEPVTAAECPANRNIQQCYAELTAIGELCEGDGECGTDDWLQNCGGWDIYRRVECPPLRKLRG